MKAKITLIVSAVLAIVILSCSADYKKTKSGLVYKIFSGGSKDSTAKYNNVIKFNVSTKSMTRFCMIAMEKCPSFSQFRRRIPDLIVLLNYLHC